MILIFGICGALRCDEISNIKFNDVEDIGNNKFIVSVKDTKTYMDRMFIIGPLFYSKVQEYMNLRPPEQFTDRFFIRYQEGKCLKQVIGKNKIGEIPRNIALYLGLPNPNRYTGHCFRRSSATLLSDSGANVQSLKQLGGWRSDKVALGYVENSMHAKENIFNGIIHASTSKNQQDSPRPILVPKPAATNRNVEEEIPVVIEWGDFLDEFTITNAASKSPEADFATAAGTHIKIPQTNISLPKNQDLLDSHVSAPAKTEAPAKQSFFEKEPVKLNFYKSDFIEPPLKKASASVQYDIKNNSGNVKTDQFETPQKKNLAMIQSNVKNQKSASSACTEDYINNNSPARYDIKTNSENLQTDQIEALQKNATMIQSNVNNPKPGPSAGIKDHMNNNSPARYENCVFNNCTFNFNS